MQCDSMAAQHTVLTGNCSPKLTLHGQLCFTPTQYGFIQTGYYVGFPSKKCFNFHRNVDVCFFHPHVVMTRMALEIAGRIVGKIFFKTQLIEISDVCVCCTTQKKVSCCDARFVIIGGTGGCHNQWWQSCIVIFRWSCLPEDDCWPALVIINAMHCGMVKVQPFNTLRLRQNCCHFADNIFKCIFQNEYERISLQISLKFVTKVRINKIPALVQIMAWCRPIMVKLLTCICITQPQWVKSTMMQCPRRQYI